MIIIHHNRDLDGYASGAICKLKYPDATLIGWDYKDPIPDFEQFRGQDVIMIDISFPIDEMIELRRRSKSLTWIDHHISAKKEFDAKLGNTPFEAHGITYVYKDRTAACEIGWEYLFYDRRVPYAITLLGRYDTWRQEEGDWEGETLPFQYGMRTHCKSPETFDPALFEERFIPTQLIAIRNEGKAILKYQEQQDAEACKRGAFVAPVGGRPAICLNTRSFSSNTMKSVYDPKFHDLMVGFEFTGTKWSVSLRSDKPDVDVSLIAKARGGGGHAGAAGFTCLDLEEIFL